jgi:lipoate-protein ligase A
VHDPGVTTLRVIDDDARDGAANMARDRALLDAMEARLLAGEQAPAPVLRFYSWSPACVSTGRHQLLDDACHADACIAEGVEIVQRPTGGRAVLHDDEITYAIVASASGAFEGAGVERGAALIARALARGLASLGAPVDAVRGVAPSSPRGAREACFLSASRSELVLQGRKIVGSAQMKGRAAILQHGSIPLRFDVERQSRLLGTPADLLRRHAAGLDEAMGERPDAALVKAAIVRGVSDELGLVPASSSFDEDESARAAALDSAWRDDARRWRAARVASR